MCFIAAKDLVEPLYKRFGSAVAGVAVVFTGVAGKQPLCSILQCIKVSLHVLCMITMSPCLPANSTGLCCIHKMPTVIKNEA